MKACVVGPGAVGGQLAAALAKGGADTTVLARGAQLAAIRNNGLTIIYPDREDRAELSASDDAQTLGEQDVVVLAVKAPALESAAAQIRPLLGDHTEVVAVMNGIPWWFMADQVRPLLDPRDTISATISRERLLGGVIYTAAHVGAPGRIVVTSPRCARLVLGEAPNARSAQKAVLATILEVGGVGVELTHNIGIDLWGKLVANIGPNLVASVYGGSLQETLANEANRETAKCIITEAKALGVAIGYPTEADHDHIIAYIADLPHRPSTLQDLDAGRTIEMDALFRAPLELARCAGVPMPTLTAWVAKLDAMIEARAKARALA